MFGLLSLNNRSGRSSSLNRRTESCRRLSGSRSIYGECHIVVGRELTKVHEQVLRGPVSAVIAALAEPKGEIVVAFNIGQYTNIAAREAPGDDRIALEFMAIAKIDGVSRRKAVVNTARRLGISPNEVYQAVERHKNSGE